ncbi:MAG: hypothetical protein Q9161_000782 [Pseudevernia consocians]
MDKNKKAKRREYQSALAKRAYPQSVNEHATELAQEFTSVNEKIKKSSIQLSSSTRKRIKASIKRAIHSSFSWKNIPQLCSQEDKKAFESLVLAEIGTNLFVETAASVPKIMLVSLHRSFQHLIPKIQALDFASQRFYRHPADSTVSTRANQDADTLLNAEAARLPLDYEIADSTDDRKSDDKKKTSKQVVQPTIGLQESLDFSPDQSELENNQESMEDSEVEIKEECEDEAAKLVSLDRTVFTITLAIPITVDDHRFCIRFNNERVVDGLSCMSSREIWQLVHDTIQRDPCIPSRTSSLPWITDVLQQYDKCLAFKTKTQEDLDTVTTNVQWVRDLRDTVSAGIKTYKVVFECTNIWKMKTEEHRDRASIIDKLREDNSGKIPSLNHIGAIRDVMMLKEPAFERKRNGYPVYILVFGSKEAANAAVENGLIFRKERRLCLVYEPDMPWHQQCSHCQSHGHTVNACQFTPRCGRCGSRHGTKYCASATTRCANCYGLHVASSAECPKWLKVEEEDARFAYRFPAEDSEPRTPTPAKPAKVTLPSPMLPLPVAQKPVHILNKKPKILLPSPKPSKAASTMPPATAKPKEYTTSHGPPQAPVTISPVSNQISSPEIPINNQPHPSALLHIIDEFRDFVAARETTQSSKKRKGFECVMAGALQDGDGKRVKREEEEEGPVWPIGQKGYRPPSLRVRGVEG